MKNTKWVIGNWKMNPATQEQAIALVASLQNHNIGTVKVAVTPVALHLGVVAQVLSSSTVMLGGQDVSIAPTTGAFTGEVSAAQMADMGVSLVLVGHSERRQYHHETNVELAKKLQALSSVNVMAVLCIGETKEEYQAGKTLTVLSEQLSVLQALDTLPELMIAYEPVWAIGTGLIPTLAEIEQVHKYIKQWVADKLAIENISVLYGGSVKSDNVQVLSDSQQIDGVLVGGASLDVKSFDEIIKSFS